jgi:hypothetical protein
MAAKIVCQLTLPWAGNLAVVQRLWDPGGFSHRSAWGQAGFQGGGNVMPWFATWATVDFGFVLWPKLAAWRRAAIK